MLCVEASSAGSVVGLRARPRTVSFRSCTLAALPAGAPRRLLQSGRQVRAGRTQAGSTGAGPERGAGHGAASRPHRAPGVCEGHGRLLGFLSRGAR